MRAQIVPGEGQRLDAFPSPVLLTLLSYNDDITITQVVLSSTTALFDKADRAPVTIVSYEMLRNQVGVGG